MVTSEEMSFSVGTYDWGEYYSFAKPVIPDSAPTSKYYDDDKAKRMYISIFGACLMIA